MFKIMGDFFNGKVIVISSLELHSLPVSFPHFLFFISKFPTYSFYSHCLIPYSLILLNVPQS